MKTTRTLFEQESTKMLLMRHADRGAIPAGELGNEVSLLPIGVERALAPK